MAAVAKRKAPKKRRMTLNPLAKGRVKIIRIWGGPKKKKT
mgnify:CR=1 FL=1